MSLLFFVPIFLVALLFLFSYRKQANFVKSDLRTFTPEWRRILYEKVVFYRSLSEDERNHFEERILHFLKSVRITGIKTSVEDIDRILIASSAIIPVFSFPSWKYKTIREVLLYPDLFNDKYETGRADCKIGGMVGTGSMDGIMILAKPLLRLGFDVNNDKMNVGIHEFLHLIDMEDGHVDGLPRVLLDHASSLPWMELCKKKIDQILNEKSDINPYGATKSAEFFAVAGEYFFERPDMLRLKHPELYRFLEKAFKSRIAERFHKDLFVQTKIRRNSPCPCGSKEKFKNCCGKDRAA